MSHAVTRAQERYGLCLTGAALSEIAAICADDKRSVLLRHADGGCEERLLVYSETALRVVYNPERRLIVTFLPLKRCYDQKLRGKQPSRAKLRRMREKRARMA